MPIYIYFLVEMVCLSFAEEYTDSFWEFEAIFIGPFL